MDDYLRGHRHGPPVIARWPLEMQGETAFHFVTQAIGSALERARAAAGDRDVSIGGGAKVVQQFLAAGLLDELVVSVVPIMLGGGGRLFDDLGEPKPRLDRCRRWTRPASPISATGARGARR